MSHKKQQKKNFQIAKFIRESGFIWELEAAECLEKSDYQVEPSQDFFDAEEGKKREIDIIARKNINNVTICLVVECKQSLGDDWIFVSTQKNPTRHFSELKHSPKIPSEILKKHKTYDDIHIYNFKVSLAQNYLVREKSGKKRHDPIQITECLFKLPKALVWTARVEAKTPTIYFPVTLFSGDLFEASYKGKLLIKEKRLIQYQTILDAPTYYDKLSTVVTLPQNSIPVTDPDVRSAKTTAKRLGKEFTIEFVNKKGLRRYLSLIDREIRALDVSIWPLVGAK